MPSTDIVPEIVRIAQRHRQPIQPISTGRNWGYGTASPSRQGTVILDLSALCAIVDFDPELGVVTIEPGVTQQHLAAFLDAGKHPYMVPVTGAGPDCSLMGNALERGFGITPATDHFGAVTDLEAVLADGTVYRSALNELGGAAIARLFRWGIGPYLNGLFTQSGFGIVTRVSIALTRRPEVVAVCLFRLADQRHLEVCGNATRRIRQQLPGVAGGVNIMNAHRVLAMVSQYPSRHEGEGRLLDADEVDQLCRRHSVSAWTGFASLYGTRRQISEAGRIIKAALKGVTRQVYVVTESRAGRLQALAAMLPGGWGAGLQKTTASLATGLELVSGRPNRTALQLAYWLRASEHVRPRTYELGRDGCGLLWYAPLVPLRGDVMTKVYEMVCSVTSRYGIEPLVTFTTLSDVVSDCTVPLLFDQASPSARDRAQCCYSALIEGGAKIGCFPYRLDVSKMADSRGALAAASSLSTRLRRAVDPDDLISPGRYW